MGKVLVDGFSAGVSWLYTTLAGISKALVDGFSAGVGYVTNMISNVGVAFKVVWDVIMMGVQGYWDLLKAVGAWIADVFVASWGGVTASVNYIYEKITGFYSMLAGIGKVMVDGFSAGVNYVMSMMSSIGDALANMLIRAIPTWVTDALAYTGVIDKAAVKGVQQATVAPIPSATPSAQPQAYVQTSNADVVAALRDATAELVAINKNTKDGTSVVVTNPVQRQSQPHPLAARLAMMGG
jgi:phage-related protein